MTRGERVMGRWVEETPHSSPLGQTPQVFPPYATSFHYTPPVSLLPPQTPRRDQSACGESRVCFAPSARRPLRTCALSAQPMLRSLRRVAIPRAARAAGAHGSRRRVAVPAPRTVHRGCQTFVSSHFRIDDGELEQYLQRKSLVVKVRGSHGESTGGSRRQRYRTDPCSPASARRRTSSSNSARSAPGRTETSRTTRGSCTFAARTAPTSATAAAPRAAFSTSRSMYARARMRIRACRGRSSHLARAPTSSGTGASLPRSRRPQPCPLLARTPAPRRSTAATCSTARFPLRCATSRGSGA